MFLIFPVILLAGLLSIPTLLLLTSLYGLELILLAHMVRNVRQETSRESLRRFVRLVALDHLLAAASAIACGVFLLAVPDYRIWVPLLEDPNSMDNTLAMVLATVLAFYCVVWSLVAVLLLIMGPDFDARISNHRQSQWEPWLVVLICTGLFLNISTAFLILAIATPLLWHLVHVTKMARQSSLVWTLTIAVRQGLPLAPEIETLADGLWGRQRLRLQLLAENLAAGVTLAAALERQPGLVPRSVLMMIRMGEETDTLIPALDACAIGYTRKNDHEIDLMSTQHGFFMLLMPVAAIPLIMGYMSFNIIPKFKRIFLDFGTEMPALTVAVIQFMEESGGFFLYFLGSLGLLGLVAYLSLKDWERDWPLLNLLAPRVNGPPILRGVALLIRQQRPLTAGIQALIWSHPRPSARLRLIEIHRQLLQGRDIADALAANRLIRRGDIPLLRAAERVQNLPWTLEQLAESMEQGFWYRIRLVLEVGQPASVLVVGIIVALVSLAFFLPLVKLLNDLS